MFQFLANRLFGHVENRGGLLDAEAAEETQLHDLAFPSIELCQGF
jgi:hypothetical protein